MKRPGRKARLLVLLAAFGITLFSACEKKEERAAPHESIMEDLPLCAIEAVKECSAESTTAQETIYFCPICGTAGQCPHCPDHDCKDCAGQSCRCRLSR